MKYFSLISIWTAAIAMSLCLRGAGKLQADPSDDFSFSLAHAPIFDVYRLMPEAKVADILQDRLRGIPAAEVPKLARHLVGLCRKYRFDPAFVLSLIEVESGFRVKVVSPQGATGLMQLMPGTALKMVRDLGLDLKNFRFQFRAESDLAMTERALMDPFFNLTTGVSYLAWLRDHYEGLSPYYLVAAYNVGPGRMDELRSRKSFKPVNTKKYYEAIRRGVPGFRFYRRAPAQALSSVPSVQS